MDTAHIVHQRATEELARLIRAQQRLVNALMCAWCGAVGLFYADDRTLLCATCYEAYERVSTDD